VKRLLVTLALVACGSDGSKMATCAHPPGAFADGDATGHPDPLHAGPSEARAGRIHGADLPVVPSGLVTWKDGDFVLANDRVALVIEDVGDSDLYDPWGGRPVGLARVAGGQLVEPANFGELFFLTGRSTIVTESVTVINNGSDGNPAIIRARGKLHPVPFFESVISAVYHDQFKDLDAAIDYELAPGSEKVDVRMRYASERMTETDVPSTLHAFMYTKRMPAFQPVLGFNDSLNNAPYIALVDDDATSWAYIPGDGALASSLSVSGFLGAFTGGYSIPACGTTDRIHASIVIGGPGLDGIQAAVARATGDAQRTITGTVTRGGVPAEGVRVHASDTGSYLTRATTDAAGHFTLNVPAGASVHLDAYKRGDMVGTADPGAGSTATIDLPATGSIHVVASPGIPVRVQVIPSGGQAIPSVPDGFGEPAITAGRLHVAYALTGDTTLTAPPGTWDVVVSRGYEYELVRQTVTVVANQTAQVNATLDHVVDTTGIQCGDFHVHTWRSNDSGDDALTKVAQAVADGVEMPVRSDHEWVGDFSSEIAQLGVGAYAASIASIELTSFEVWGHMGVVPLTPDPTAVNNGAPKWQTFPTAAAPDTPFTTLSPVQVFDTVRARPEQPLVIINHPHSGVNYFPYVGYDPATGTATDGADWDTKFTLVEVFNNSSWKENRNGTVDDWLGMLKAGRKVFAVGSSDSHGIAGSPVGYPRTCIALGTDDPRQLTPSLVRDQLAAGHATVSGGIYVTAKLGTAGPGDTTTGAGTPLQVDVTLQAPTWIDVTGIDVIVDGATVDSIPVMPGDADPQNPAIRWHGQIPVTTLPTGGFVIIAAYGDHDLDPVHPGHIPFGVTNPIFVTP
jgi:hypothetical protein